MSPSVAAAIATLPGVPPASSRTSGETAAAPAPRSAARVSAETGGVRVSAISAAIAAGVATLPSATCARRAVSSPGRFRASAANGGTAASA